MSKKTAIFLTLLVLIIVIIGGGWYYRISQYGQKRSVEVPIQKIEAESSFDKPLPDSDPRSPMNPVSWWNTYADDTFGVRFKYPQDYTVIQQPGSSVAFGRVLVVDTIGWNKVRAQDSL